MKANWREPERAFSHWYVNLETPLRPSGFGFDRVDQVLDVVIAPDLVSWRWKDEDEFAEAIMAGRITAAEGEEVRAAGLRAVERAGAREAPFNEGWEHWTSDPSWPIPELPAGWEKV